MRAPSTRVLPSVSNAKEQAGAEDDIQAPTVAGRPQRRGGQGAGGAEGPHASTSEGDWEMQAKGNRPRLQHLRAE